MKPTLDILPYKSGRYRRVVFTLCFRKGPIARLELTTTPRPPWLDLRVDQPYRGRGYSFTLLRAVQQYMAEHAAPFAEFEAANLKYWRHLAKKFPTIVRIRKAVRKSYANSVIALGTLKAAPLLPAPVQVKTA